MPVRTRPSRHPEDRGRIIWSDPAVKQALILLTMSICSLALSVTVLVTRLAG